MVTALLVLSDHSVHGGDAGKTKQERLKSSSRLRFVLESHLLLDKDNNLLKEYVEQDLL